MEKQKKEGTVPSSITSPSVFNYSEFQSVILELMGNSTQLELSKITGIANTHISRILNGHRTNKPTLSTVQKLAHATSDQHLLMRLFRSAGYEADGIEYIANLPADIVPKTVPAHNPEPYFHLIMKIFALLREQRQIDWILKSGSPYSDQFVISLQKDTKEWHLLVADAMDATEDSVLLLYGIISHVLCEKPGKFTLITASNAYFNLFTNTLPYNLDAEVSVILVDPSVKTVLIEKNLTEKRTPVFGELNLDLTTL